MISALLLIMAALVYRVAAALAVAHGGSSWLLNFAPLAAIALCGAIYFPPKFKFTIPLAALFVSDLVLDFCYGASLADPLMLCRYGAFLLVGLLGLMIRRRAALPVILSASVVGSTIFYLTTNFFSWIMDPGYAKTFAGLWQSLTVGLPQYAATPTWMFFRNSLLSDLLFTLLFVACMRWSAASTRRLAGASEPLPN